MDQLGKTMNNLSLWEMKSYVRKAQNAVLNLSETEAKVREATNNEPWGASTTLMADIARGTFNYREREEICNMIFRRFTEKSAHEWRQIYKSLQLMEYLVKNGSERFVDDARANVSLVSMLKSFHYIDSKGVDQGINIRNRAKELTNLMNDESKIRQERKKAKENAKKYDAISSTSASSRGIGRRAPGASGGYSGSSSRNISVSADDDGYENRIFGDGGVYGQRFEESRSSNINPNSFEEYDEGQQHTTNNNSHSNTNNRRTSKPSVETSNVNARANVDLFSFDDAPPTLSTPSHDINNEDFDDDDDFDDFQSATPAAPTQTTSNKNGNNLSGLLNSSYSQSTYNNTNNGYSSNTPTPAISQPKKNDDIFGSLLASAQTSASKPISVKPLASKPTYASTPAQTPAPAQTNSSSNGDIVDLLDL
ncbi:Epsin-3, clathrin recruitment and traffic between the Golgi and endosome [Pichia californica]|nr:Epsin-3, clathrin recruitment and traffic between the Golgi and endosome [[Candida] californica]